MLDPPKMTKHATALRLHRGRSFGSRIGQSVLVIFQNGIFYTCFVYVGETVMSWFDGVQFLDYASKGAAKKF